MRPYQQGSLAKEFDISILNWGKAVSRYLDPDYNMRREDVSK